MAQQTAVEWLIEEIKKFDSGRSQYYSKIAIYNHAYRMEKEQSHNYADFCVRCDRDQMKLLDFNDYMKIYNNGL